MGDLSATYNLHLMMNEDLEGAFLYLDLFPMSGTQPGVNGEKGVWNNGDGI